MQRRKRWIWLGMGLLILVVLTLVAAPQNVGLRQGSTYSRAPSGYGAWYAAMEAEGIDIQRWQKPIEQLSQPPSPFTSSPANSSQASSPLSPESPITLLQIDSGQSWLTTPDRAWIEQGNVVVLLGSRFADGFGAPTTITNASFTTFLSSAAGKVKIQTRRRFDTDLLASQPQRYESLLEDRFGAAVVATPVGKGKVVVAVTPYLAANAYQDEPGNLKFLTQLVRQPGYPIWVDEYLHGYKDADVIATEQEGILTSYLAKTPIGLIAVQVVVILLILVWGLNQRLGPTLTLTQPKVDNSEAYIRALASVLQKANCSEFVVQTVGKAEQLQVQRSLGLGTDLLDPTTVIDTWKQQTGQSASDLEEILQVVTAPRRLTEAELLIWLRKAQTIRQHLS